MLVTQLCGCRSLEKVDRKSRRGNQVDSVALMQISTILVHIDSGNMAMPKFQRGYVWNRDQVRGLFDSLYRRYPVGGLLVWANEAKTAAHCGDVPVAVEIVKLLLDGQQRITSLHGVVRGRPSKFFEGNVQTFTGLDLVNIEAGFSLF